MTILKHDQTCFIEMNLQIQFIEWIINIACHRAIEYCLNNVLCSHANESCWVLNEVSNFISPHEKQQGQRIYNCHSLYIRNAKYSRAIVCRNTYTPGNGHRGSSALASEAKSLLREHQNMFAFRTDFPSVNK